MNFNLFWRSEVKGKKRKARWGLEVRELRSLELQQEIFETIQLTANLFYFKSFSI